MPILPVCFSVMLMLMMSMMGVYFDVIFTTNKSYFYSQQTRKHRKHPSTGKLCFHCQKKVIFSISTGKKPHKSFFANSSSIQYANEENL